VELPIAFCLVQLHIESSVVLDCDMSYKLVVNGKPFTVDAPENMPLLWVLRDVLNLRGTKYGCGIGQCGACTVHFGGRAVRSCQTPVAAAADAQITTVEGLSLDGTHPVQLAWAELDVPQCGYCQAGQMMSAAALLAKNSKPTDQEIDAAMNGNICRCGTYIRIRQAIHKAAALKASRAENRPVEVEFADRTYLERSDLGSLSR
jgi:isoquinoline 1-oxidoreductase alpha subunit